MLECEREEAKRQLQQLEEVYEASSSTLQQQIEHWRLSYEDVLSQLNFNPATRRIQEMELEIEDLNRELKEAKEYIAVEMEKVKHHIEQVKKKDQQIGELTKSRAAVEERR